MFKQNAFTIVFAIFLLYTCKDVFYGQSDLAKSSGVNEASQHHHGHFASSDGFADPSQTSGGVGNPTVRIQYCHSCGYKQAFDDISKMLRLKFPDLSVEGELHQPNFLRAQLVNLIFLAKIAVIAMLYMEINPFTRLQMETPRIWLYMSQSKVSSALLILFLANSIESNMMSTGAFEIFYNDMPVWSKIQAGRMPTAPELLQIVQSHTSLGHKSRVGEFVHS